VVEGALQRIEGWRGGRTPPLGGPLPPLVGFRGAPRTPSPPNQDGYVFPPDPLAFRRPSGVRPASRDTRPRGRLPALLALSCPSRDMPQQPRTAASPARRSRRTDGVTRPAMLPLLGFRALRHSLGPADPRHWRTDPSAAACHVRGLATSFAASTTGPPGARGAGASMGFALQGVPLVAMGSPLGVPALLTLPSARAPEGERDPSGRLQGLVPATSPFRRHPPPEGRERPPIPS